MDEDMHQEPLTYNSQGYPKREGKAEQCEFFVKNGQCKFGTTCKNHHPEFIYPGVDFNSRGFPLRPDATDCEFYSKMQECKYGCMCKFNHPETGPKRQPQFVPVQQPVYLQQQVGIQQQLVQPSIAVGTNASAFPRRPGQAACQFFLKTGQCKFAATCKFDHPVPQQMGGIVQMQPVQTIIQQQPQQIMQVATPAPTPKTEPDGFNAKGLPVRIGVQICAFFSKTGECKFGQTCKWDHTEQAQGQPQQMQIKSSGSAAGMEDAIEGTNSLGYPLRSGVTACNFFAKTGQCSYGSSCKWNHPEEFCNNPGSGTSTTSEQAQPSGFNSLGFPIRTGQQICSFYLKTGQCSYGTGCRFDHPEGLGGVQPDGGLQKTPTQTLTRIQPMPY